MNKKQAVIIVALLVLIISMGVLATMVNSPLNLSDTTTGTTNGKNTVSANDNSKGKKTATTTNSSFDEMRLSKAQSREQAMQVLKNIMDDKNVSQDSKNNAAVESTNLTKDSLNENKIEQTLKNRGYQDVICSIDENPSRVKLIVKSKNNLTDKQMRDIKDDVASTAQISNIEIEVKQ